MTLIQCIYSSSASNPELGTRDLHEILEVSRLNNAALGITGMLILDEGSFFQVLEGEANTIDELFQKLHKDSRHSRINMLISEPIEERSFAE